MRSLAMVFLTLLATSAQAGWFGPSNYEECILENVQGTSSKRAIFMIRRACQHPYGIFQGPNGFHKCLLGKLPGVQDDSAATLIAKACRETTDFPRLPETCTYSEFDGQFVARTQFSDLASPECEAAVAALERYLRYK